MRNEPMAAGGTGRFSGATGELFDQGALDQAGSFADAPLSGMICLQRGQDD
jgi:hypothetical protein